MHCEMFIIDVSCFISLEKVTVICVVLLQDCMGFVEGETGYCSETCVTCNVDGTEEVSAEGEDPLDIKEEVSIKVEDTIDIKDEIPQPIVFPPIKTEPEVRLWGVCEVVAADVLCHLLSQIGNYEVSLSYFLLCAILWVPYTF
jgi:hypothetical protein